MSSSFYDFSELEQIDEIVEYLKNILNEKKYKKVRSSNFLKSFAIDYNITFEYARQSLYHSIYDNKVKLNSDYSLSLVE